MKVIEDQKLCWIPAYGQNGGMEIPDELSSRFIDAFTKLEEIEAEIDRFQREVNSWGKPRKQS